MGQCRRVGKGIGEVGRVGECGMVGELGRVIKLAGWESGAG